MSTAKPSQPPTTRRYDRYRTILEFVLRSPGFDLESAKQACLPERPAFVTRVINQLVDQGWLLREHPASSFAWNSGRGNFCLNRWLDEQLCGTQVKAAPMQDRPRERLLELGAEPLKDAELIAILVRTGRPGESAVQAGEKIAKAYRSRLSALVSAGRSELHPREVFRPAIRDASAAVLLVHNHPSGDPTPSAQDVEVTKRIRTAGSMLGIEVLDHIVLGRNQALSIRATCNV